MIEIVEYGRRIIMVSNQFGKKNAMQPYIEWLKKIKKSGEIFKIAKKRYG